MAKIREENLKEGGLTSNGLVQQGYLDSVQIGDGQEEMDPSREIRCGHQQALSLWSKRQRQR